MAYGEVQDAAEALKRILDQRGMRRENYSIGIGSHTVHVYAKCAEREWGCAKPTMVQFVNVEWHWDIGPATAYSSG